MVKVVLLGGGYAGVHAAKKLYKSLKKEEAEITLIDRNPFHTLMTELHEVAGERVPEGSVRLSYDRIFAGTRVKVVRDEILRIDPEGRRLFSEKGEYPYDYLLLSTGGETADFNIPGVADHALPLWSYDHALRIRSHIRSVFRRASLEGDREKRKSLLTFAVAGAGFTGVEMVGELIEGLPLLCREHHIDPREIRLINVEGMGQILNMIPEKPRAKAVRYMEKKGVEILLNALIVGVDEESFTLKGGVRIPCGTLIWTCGVKGSAFGKGSGLALGHVDRLKADKTMQSPGQPRIYLAGDALWLLEGERPVPQIVEAAEQTAAVAAHNIAREITGKGELREFRSRFHGFMVSIGGRYGVSHTGGVSLSGFPAMALKHLVNLYYLHGAAGVNGWWGYLKHEIFGIKNKRSLLGGLVAGRINGLWALPLRLWLGLMWVVEGLNKVGEGWLDFGAGSRSAWMFSPGIRQAGLPGGSDGGSAASEAAGSIVEETAWAADTLAAASGGGASPEPLVDTAVPAAADAWTAASGALSEAAAETVQSAPHALGPLWDTSGSILSWDNPLVVWFRQTFMDGMAAALPFSFFQVMVVSVEVALGLALMGGLFTFPAAGVSILMCLVFLLSGLFSWSQLWFVFAAAVLLGGAGRTCGLDYWVMPWLKGLWNRSSLAHKTRLYEGEPAGKLPRGRG